MTIDDIEESCARRRMTLVLHPAIRQAIRGYEESLQVGLKAYLQDESEALFFLPVEGNGYVQLAFSTRRSPIGHLILRIDPLDPAELRRIKLSLPAARPV